MKSGKSKTIAVLLISAVFMIGAASVGAYAAASEEIAVEETEVVSENQALPDAVSDVPDTAPEEGQKDGAGVGGDDAAAEDDAGSDDTDPAEDPEGAVDTDIVPLAEADGTSDAAPNEDSGTDAEDDSAADILLITDGSSSPYAPESIVGNLAIIARYTEGETIYYGHSYVLFTSYLDDLTLNFTDLYGYYTFDEDFKILAAQDTDVLSWRYDFDRLAAELYPDLTLEEYTSLSMEERANTYPDLYNALVDIAENQCFILHLGEEQEDSRYRVVAYDYELNKGDYLTIGNYNMSGSTVKSIIDAVLNSTISQELQDLLQKFVSDGASTDQIISDVSDIYTSYVNGQITKDQLLPTISAYLKNTVSADGYGEIVSNYLDEFDITEFFDGNTTGGILVNRELYQQKVGWDQSPNRVYSIDITGRQLDDMVAYVNSGINYFNAIFHNCSSVSSGISNAVIGYVRDEDGNNTEEKSVLYIDPSDTTYKWTFGLIDSPKQVYETIDSWDNDTSDGVKDEWEIVHGVAVPDDDSNTDPVPASETVPVSHTAAGSVSGTEVKSPQTGDHTHYPELVCLMVASGLGLLWMRRLRKANTDRQK